jgi:hypothetical protein
MNINLIIEFINLFFAGILAGLEVSVHYGFHAPTVALEEKPQIILRQGVVRRLRWLVPAFFVPTALSGIAVTIIDGTAPGLFLRLAAIVAIIIWIFVRVVATVRINSATLDWDPNAPPKNWRELVGKAERFHIVGTWTALLTFILFLIAMALRLVGQ